jgi:plasmid stability protein
VATKAIKPAERSAAKANLTLRLDKNVIRRIRVRAAEQGVSISAAVAAKFDESSESTYSSTRIDPKSYEAAMKRAIALMNKGLPGKWEKPLTRDEMHERR